MCSSQRILFRSSIAFMCFYCLMIDIIISCGVNWSFISALFVVSIIYSVCFFLSKQYSSCSFLFLASLNLMHYSRLSLSLRASSSSCSSFSLSESMPSNFGCSFSIYNWVFTLIASIWFLCSICNLWHSASILAYLSLRTSFVTFLVTSIRSCWLYIISLYSWNLSSFF